MGASSVLSNDFHIHFDEAKQVLRVSVFRSGHQEALPIDITLDTLRSMDDPEAASRFFGETILLLIPLVRTKLFGLAEE